MLRIRLSPTAAALCVALVAGEATAAEPPTVGPPPEPAAPAAPAAPASPRYVRFVATVGYDYGFEDLLKVGYKGGGTDRLGSNGGSVLAVGAAVPLRSDGAVDLRATAGIKYDLVYGSNGSAHFIAFPLDLMLGVTLKRVRLAGGPSLLLGPRVRGAGFLADANLDLRNSLGLVGQLELVLPFRAADGAFAVGARYTWQKLQASTGGNAIDASAVGLMASVIL
jgi:hypothetical protein